MRSASERSEPVRSGPVRSEPVRSERPERPERPERSVCGGSALNSLDVAIERSVSTELAGWLSRGGSELRGHGGGRGRETEKGREGVRESVCLASLGSTHPHPHAQKVTVFSYIQPYIGHLHPYPPIGHLATPLPFHSAPMYIFTTLHTWLPSPLPSHRPPTLQPYIPSHRSPTPLATPLPSHSQPTPLPSHRPPTYNPTYLPIGHLHP